MRKEIHKILSDNVPEVGGRVYPLIMPQDTKHNCIVYRVIGTADAMSISCPDPLYTKHMVQLDLFAHTYAQSVELLDKVASVLRHKFHASNLMTYEDYANITVKYRQIINVELQLKQVFAPPNIPLNAWVDGSGATWTDGSGATWTEN